MEAADGNFIFKILSFGKTAEGMELGPDPSSRCPFCPFSFEHAHVEVTGWKDMKGGKLRTELKLTAEGRL